MKKILAVLISLGLLTSILSGCGEQKTTTGSEGTIQSTAAAEAAKTEASNQDENVTIKVFFNSLDHQTYLKPINDGFMQKYPNIKLEFDTPGSTNYETVLKTKLVSGEPPDIFSIWSGGMMVDYAAKGHLLDITSNEYIGRVTDICRDAYTVKGKVYGIGWNMVGEGLYYNKKIFNDFKIEVPKNWDEFLAACETIKKNNLVPLASGFKDDWTIIRFICSAAPSIVEGRDAEYDKKIVSGEAKFSDKNMLEVYQKFQTLLDKGYYDEHPLSTDYNMANTMFTQGKAAMLVQGGWALSALREANKDMDLGFMPLPSNNSGEEMLGCWHVEVGMGISAKTKNADACNKYFDYFTTPDVYNSYITSKKVYSILKDVNPKIDPATDEYVNNYVNTGKVKNWTSEYWPNTLINNWKKELQNMVAKAVTPDQMVKWMDEEFARSENLYK